MYMQHAASSYHSLQSFDLSTLASFFHTHTHTHNELPSSPTALRRCYSAQALTRPFRPNTAIPADTSHLAGHGASRPPFYHLWHLPFGRRWWFSLLDLRSGRTAVSSIYHQHYQQQISWVRHHRFRRASAHCTCLHVMCERDIALHISCNSTAPPKCT